MNCQSCQIEIEELELGEPLSDAASLHVNACEECRAFRDERQSLRRLVGGLGTVSAPPDFEFRLRARLAAASNGGNRHFPLRTFFASAPAVALAASFALLVAGVIIYKQVRTKTAATPTPEVAQAGEQKTVNSASTSSTETNKENSDKGNDIVPVVQSTNSKKQVPLTASGGSTVRRQSKQANTVAQLSTSNDTAIRPAPRITPSNDSQLTSVSNQLVQLPVRSSMQPMRVSLDDKNGAKHTVTLEPVVFGSQDFTGRNLSRNTSPSDIW